MKIIKDGAEFMAEMESHVGWAYSPTVSRGENDGGRVRPPYNEVCTIRSCTHHLRSR